MTQGVHPCVLYILANKYMSLEKFCSLSTQKESYCKHDIYYQCKVSCAISVSRDTTTVVINWHSQIIFTDLAPMG